MANKGKVVQIIGPVVDCEFEEKHLPPIYNSVIIEGETPAGQHPGDHRGAAAPGRKPGPLREHAADRRHGARHESHRISGSRSGFRSDGGRSAGS